MKSRVKRMILRIMLVIASIVGILVLAIVVNILVTNWKMKHMTLTERLDYVFDKYEEKSKSGGMAFLVEDETGFTWSSESGDLQNDKEYPIASITKLYTTAVIFCMEEEGKLSLDDKIAQYLSAEVIEGIHIYKGKDYSGDITIKQLLSQTSGLPDYYTQDSKNYAALSKTFSTDQGVSFDEILLRTKELKPHFNPGEKDKAYYSDLNFDLLGKIIEQMSGDSLENNYKKYIYDKLGIQSTYLFQPGMEFDFPGVWYQGEIYKVPNILATVGASGGIVSTKTDNMKFIKAFFNGELFSKDYMKVMTEQYRSLQFFPMQYGTGIMRFKMPVSPQLIGHSGSTGTLCYYSPQYQIYITGSINECNEVKSTQIAAELANCFAYEGEGQ